MTTYEHSCPTRPAALRATSRRASLALALVVFAVGRAARGDAKVDLSASVRADFSYDSNVFNGKGADFVTRITPRVALYAHDLRLDLKLAYDVGIWIYALGKATSSVNHHGALAVDYRITRRLSLHVADEIIYAGDPGYLTRAGVVAPQTSIFDNIVDVSLAYRLTRRVQGTLLYSYRHTVFGDVPPGSPPLFDGDEHDGALAIAIAATRADEVTAAFREQYITAGGAGLAVTHSPALGYRRRFLRTLELRLEVGPVAYQQLDTALVTVPGIGQSQTGWTWRGAGTLRYAAPRLRASLTAARDLVGGTGEAAVLWADYLYAQVVALLDGGVDLRAGFGVFANGLAPNQARLYDGFSVDAGVDFIALPELRIGAYYSFRWQEANAPDGGLAPLPSITRHIVGLRLTGVFGAEARPARRRALH